MSGQTLKLLLDTNVWLDLFIPSSPGHGAAWDFMQATAAYDDSAGREVVLLYPARIMGDVFYKVRLEAKRWLGASRQGTAEERARACRDHAWDCVQDMHELATAVDTDESDVWLALKYRSVHEDLEDDFVLAAADRAQADYLVTSDARLARKARTATGTPLELCERMAAQLL